MAFEANHLENCRRRFEESANPVWVWHAIWVCGGGISGDKHPLPDWCLEYLFASATNIESLWSRKPFEPALGSDRERLTWEEALALIPFALGLSRQGRNSLKEAGTNEYNAHLAVKYDLELAAEDLSRAQALEQLSNDTNIDEASLRKRLTLGRKLAGSKQRPARKPSKAGTRKQEPKLSIDEWMERNPLPKDQTGSKDKPSKDKPKG